jgi:hypothetical protein
MKTILLGTVLLSAPGLLYTGAAHACEDAELERTNRIYEHMVFVSGTCNQSGTVEDSKRCLEEEWGYTVQKMSTLPESCREMLRKFEPQE